MTTIKKLELAWKYRRPSWKYRKLIARRRQIATGLLVAGAVAVAIIVFSGRENR